MGDVVIPYIPLSLNVEWGGRKVKMCFLECFCVFSDEVARFLALLNSEGLSRQEFRKLSLPTTIN